MTQEPMSERQEAQAKIKTARDNGIKLGIRVGFAIGCLVGGLLVYFR